MSKSMKSEHGSCKDFKYEDTKLPGWAIDYFQGLHYPEKQVIAQRLNEYEGMDRVFSNIDDQLSAYEVDVYKEIEGNLPTDKIFTKNNILSSIEKVYFDTYKKIPTYNTSGKRELFTGLKALHDKIEILRPFPSLKKERIIEYLKEISPEIDITLDRRIGRRTVLAAIIDSAVFANPKATRKRRDDVIDGKKLSPRIVKTATKLINLLDSYKEIRGRGAIYHAADIDLLWLFKNAAGCMLPAERVYKYETYIEPHICEAEDSSNLNDEYYPTIQEVLQELCEEMGNNPIRPPYDGVDWRKILESKKVNSSKKQGSRKMSKKDCVRYLLLRIEEAKKERRLPESFMLHDALIVDIIGCTLSLENSIDLSEIGKIRKELTR